MSQKTNKSYSKRLKISNPRKGTPVVQMRKKGYNHFNGKMSGKARMAGRKDLVSDLPRNVLITNLPHSNV